MGSTLILSRKTPEPADLEEDGEVMDAVFEEVEEEEEDDGLEDANYDEWNDGERMRDHRPLNLCKGSLNQEPLRFSVR